MKVAFALLTDFRVHNLMRKLAIDINLKYKVGLSSSQLPTHISLKQPFQITDLNEVERYFDELASTIKPLYIYIPEVYVWISEQMGGIFLDVKETNELRSLHNRINCELNERFGDTKAPFDGDAYHFHATIALGGPAPMKAYQEYFNQIEKKVNLSFKAKEIIMFYSTDDDRYITYKILPLTGR